MVTYLASIERRKGLSNVIGPFSKRDDLLDEISKQMGIDLEKWKTYTTFGSSFDEGKYYTTEFSLEIFERELK